MLKFVVCSNNKKNIKCYELLVDKLLIKEETDYKYYNYNLPSDDLHKFIKEGEETKIYLIEESDEISSLDLLKTIRNSYNDLNSFIIIIDKKGKVQENYIENNYLINTKVIKNISKLPDILNQIIKFYIGKKDKLTYQYNGCFYNITFSKILYIEKQLDSKLCNIICTDNTYCINSSLTKMLEILNKDFIRTHQSAIVNLNNVETIDFTNKIIGFINGEKTNLFSRSYKKEVKDVITKKCQKVTE